MRTTRQSKITGGAAGTTDRQRLMRALNISLGFIFLLLLAYWGQQHIDWRPFAVSPRNAEGLLGILTAPLLHGSIEHIAANCVALLILGTLAGSVYPQATVRGLPLMWLGSGLGAWLLGYPGTYHLGASGITHGLMFLLFVEGLLRRDRAAIATSMIAFLFYGSMLLTVLPREPGVSWQSHMGGAIGGAIAAWLFWRRDPIAPRKRYSWEIEEEREAERREREYNELELPTPEEVPVLRQPQAEAPRDKVVPLRRPERD